MSKEYDHSGEAISGIRMDPAEAYNNISELLQQFINNEDYAAWEEIVHKIDYIYVNMDYVLSELSQETGFTDEVRLQISNGKKLLFKPNLLAPYAIEEKEHCAGAGCVYSTQWTFVAAVMRWFHDKLQIKYSQMSVGEASPNIITLSRMLGKTAGRNITTEAVIEGRSKDFYGGWGFYFVRKYLSECQHGQWDSYDDPMKGYEESIEGIFLPPGRVEERMMVYDLNKLQEDLTRGRTISVPDGSNYNEITIHKAIIGGDPNDDNDIRDYPGCILINLPKLKMHAQDLITNALKNLGIGLYPMESAEGREKDSTDWKYAFPYNRNPSLKAKLPHSRWVIALDENTLLPLKDESGDVIITRTEGFSGTQTDIIKAVQSQNISMLHITDAIYVLNISHDPGVRAEIIPEGYIWASLDCVALDLFCARYCFKTVPMMTALKYKQEYNWNTEFVRHVPLPCINGRNISTQVGIDSPLFLYNLFNFAAERGVGRLHYYVTGWDSLNQAPLVSVHGHLGRISDGHFIEMMTQTMYYNPMTILHDLQLTMLSYAMATDTLTGSHFYNELMDTFDENYDGVIDYDEKAGGYETAQLCVMSYISGLKLDPGYGSLKGDFINTSYFAKYADSKYNMDGYDYMKGKILVGILAEAYKMSQSKEIIQDPFAPGMCYGRGNWPSYQTVYYKQTMAAIYGTDVRDSISLFSLYGIAFRYADKVQNNGKYTGSIEADVNGPEAINNYLSDVSMGNVPLDFTLYIPKGYGSLQGVTIPNIEETENPDKIYRVSFKEMW